MLTGIPFALTGGIIALWLRDTRYRYRRRWPHRAIGCSRTQRARDDLFHPIPAATKVRRSMLRSAKGR